MDNETKLAPIDELRLLAIRNELENLASGEPCIAAIEIEPCFEIDLRFTARGDLYDAESAAVKIMAKLRKEFPEFGFDLVVVPAGRDEGERHGA